MVDEYVVGRMQRDLGGLRALAAEPLSRMNPVGPPS